MINRSRPISRYIFTNLKFITSFNLTPRSYCTSKKNEWADQKIDYLDESSTLIHSGPGIRYTEPGIDNHIMVGGLKQPFSNSHAVAKIVEIVRRWKWGPQMETHLDKLQFVPNMTHVMQALKVVRDGDACLSLFKWAKRQEWYKASDEVYVSLIERLNECRDFDGIQSVFDDLVDDKAKVKVNGFSAFSRIVQYLAKAEKLEVSFCCFKKIQESGCRVDTKTYNSLINLFLEKGLPFKAFEIYENMEGSGCSLDGGTLMRVYVVV